MTPAQLRRRVRKLNPDTPLHKQLEIDLSEGVGFGEAWYRSQQEHWDGWLREYDGPGAYGRAAGTRRDARFVYNHVQCAPMLLWLAEAVGVETALIIAASDAVRAAPERNASQCGALRKVIPWEMIAHRLEPATRWEQVARILK